MALIRPVTPEEQEIANLSYGKNMEDLTIGERTKLRKKIASGTIDTITFEQYFEDLNNEDEDMSFSTLQRSTSAPSHVVNRTQTQRQPPTQNTTVLQAPQLTRQHRVSFYDDDTSHYPNFNS